MRFERCSCRRLLSFESHAKALCASGQLVSSFQRGLRVYLIGATLPYRLRSSSPFLTRKIPVRLAPFAISVSADQAGDATTHGEGFVISDRLRSRVPPEMLLRQRRRIWGKPWQFITAPDVLTF